MSKLNPNPPLTTPQVHSSLALLGGPLLCLDREFFIDNLLVRVHFISVMIRWAGLAG